ncbi:IS1182 family transposase [Bacillus sp. FJAT-50079]|uniref:IS1182 family transposase n=3 Tax=Bacillus sp. FJAT-50079 TaxID=2833577 RepID=UPI001BC936CB|nr:IS1182 family transposase [Bacillus sp. FJAT-50079]MBS4209867.1 IS1182 family transposase [Bacillus sp. FJAT-50079]
MMTKNQINEREQLEMLTIEQLVPQNHLVRKLDAAIDFSFIYPLVEDLYSTIGRPSIDPVVLIKMTFIQYTFGIRSMRQTIKEIETNVAYRWFLGFGFHTEVPHFSTFGKNYVRRFADTDLFEQIFYKVLNEVTNRGLLSPDHVFIDSTHVKASANKRKFEKKVVRKETRAYEKRLQEELNLDREKNGKKPFPPEKFETEEYKEIKESTTDPESGYYVKDERTKQFAYSFHAATDEKGFVLANIVTPGNVHDSNMLEPLVQKIIDQVGRPIVVAADAAYKTPAIANFLIENQVLPALPYKRSICATCPVLSQCTESKNHQKRIQRHIWQDYLDVAEDLRHNHEIKEIYGKRKETIERVFADAKEKHGMRWTTLKGIKKLSMQAMLTFAALNLKKLASWTWKTPTIA